MSVINNAYHSNYSFSYIKHIKFTIRYADWSIRKPEGMHV